MAFRPDIIVTNRDTQELALVVEVKRHIHDMGAVEQQIRHYMFGMRAPVGMIVTPTALRVYRDRHKEYGEGSIELVGEYPIFDALASDLVAARRAEDATPRHVVQEGGFELEGAVQAWLERMARPSERAALPEPLREALEQHVVPALEQGDVRAAGPRWRRTGS